VYCGAGGAIGGEIVPPPPTHVSLDTAQSGGHKISETRRRARLPTKQRGALPSVQRTGGYKSRPCGGGAQDLRAPRLYGADRV
jgi:hypothetical protein